MENSKSKRDIFYLILLILTLIIMIVGITFTYYSLMLSEKKDSTMIKTGTIAINYVDGREFNTYELLPIDEPNLDSKYSVYKKQFSVRSDGTLDQTIDIYIKVTENGFTNNALKFALYNSNNKKLSTGFIPSTGDVLIYSNDYLKSGSTNSYTVLIWLQENNQNQDHESGKSFVGGFEITAEQVKLK